MTVRITITPPERLTLAPAEMPNGTVYLKPGVDGIRMKTTAPIKPDEVRFLRVSDMELFSESDPSIPAIVLAHSLEEWMSRDEEERLTPVPVDKVLSKDLRTGAVFTRKGVTTRSYVRVNPGSCAPTPGIYVMQLDAQGSSTLKIQRWSDLDSDVEVDLLGYWEAS